MHTPVDLACRTMEDIVVPLQFPIRGHIGAMTSKLPIAKGTYVYLGLAAANQSAKIWGPDATEYKPERWLDKQGSIAKNTKLPGIYSNM